MKRIFLIVLDSCGAGEMPDAAKFGDFGVNTLKSCSTSSKLHIPTMVHCGLGNIEGLSFLGTDPAQTGACARMAEASMGKDTTIGHWEIAGVVSPNPLPTYPNGFPEEVLKPFHEATGRGVLANAPWSGTEVIAKYGAEHMRTGDLIVYTSADSVFQIAAHEDIVPLEQLYEYCRIARKILVGSMASAASSPVRSSATRRTASPARPTATTSRSSRPQRPCLTPSRPPVRTSLPSARSTISSQAAA